MILPGGELSTWEYHVNKSKVKGPLEGMVLAFFFAACTDEAESARITAIAASAAITLYFKAECMGMLSLWILGIFLRLTFVAPLEMSHIVKRFIETFQLADKYPSVFLNVKRRIIVF